MKYFEDRGEMTPKEYRAYLKSLVGRNSRLLTSTVGDCLRKGELAERVERQIANLRAMTLILISKHAEYEKEVREKYATRSKTNP